MGDSNPEMMTLPESQRDMRSSFLGGFAGQLVSGLIWLIASILSVVFSPQYGMVFLFFGGMLIFPLTQLSLRLMGRPAKTKTENGLWGLGSQVAFTVPLNFVLVGAAALYKPEWFFPAAMVVIGSHYLPFITLYGMRIYGALSVLLIACGIGLALYGPPIFSLGGWLTSLILISFAFMIKAIVQNEEDVPA